MTDADPDAQLDELADDLLDDDSDADASDDDLFDEDAVAADDSDDGDESDESRVPLDVSEDGDDELTGEPRVDLTAIDGLDVDDPLELAAEEAEQADADDTVRADEFVCRSCHMAKRASALADEDEMLCRDCV